MNKAAKQINCPVMLVHGDKDDVVISQQSKELFKRLKEPKRLHIIKNADHGFSKHERELEKSVEGWFLKWV